MAETLLINAARTMHVEKVITPALEEGKVVLCDRFADSTLAYQGYGYGFNLDVIKDIHAFVFGDLKPDITFVLDIDPEIGLKRSGRRLAAEALQVEQSEDRFENMDMSFHENLRRGFLEIAKDHPDRCVVMDASQDPNEMADRIFEHINARLMNT